MSTKQTVYFNSSNLWNSHSREYDVFNSILTDGINYSIKAPANSNIAPPGYYMLFVLKSKNQSISGEVRIPSEAVFVKLS